ncbi:MAG: alginate lyase family protein [Rhodobacterales bacterium]|nr:alginate lyase family protein [Rhodobacterales bacterium]
MMRHAIAALMMLFSGTTAGLAEQCAEPPEPVLSLSFGSRYSDQTGTRSQIDTAAAEEADGALRPVDDFLRDLTTDASKVFEDDADRQDVADCIIARISVWARADAMSDLSSETANLTVGSRIAGFGLVLLQVIPFASPSSDVDDIKDWLRKLMRAQTTYWENEAPDGARQGNLRAWAALGGASAATILEDPALRAWSAWSISHIMCSASDDGSLPQEMGRGKFALHYQLHAISPLVVSTLLLERQGIDVQNVCDGALSRIIRFAMNDIDDGAATTAITGDVQSFFDGSDEFEGFYFAWIEAYLQLDDMPDHDALDRFAEQYRPIHYSKLGGDQTLIWQNLQ